MRAMALPKLLELVTDGLDEPSNLASPPDGRGRIYVIDYHEAEIRVIADGRLLPEVFLDLSDRLIPDPDPEDGVLSLAFSPRFPEMPYVYVTFVDVHGDLALSRFEVMPSGLEAIAASEQVLLTLPRYVPMHHCGHLAFGPHDGLLYLCVGDTQGNGNVEPIAQDPDEPRGKILRLDVEPRMIAGVQPIAETAPSGSYEIWMKGLRNPWRFGFDPATGDLYIPDVGRRAWEEINVLAAPIQRGGNFGWPLAEGNDCIAQCDRGDLIWPTFEYPHGNDRCAVIGGAVYRGTAFPQWQGVFLFSDQCSGEIWALRNLAGAAEVRMRRRDRPDGLCPGHPVRRRDPDRRPACGRDLEARPAGCRRRVDTSGRGHVRHGHAGEARQDRLGAGASRPHRRIAGLAADGVADARPQGISVAREDLLIRSRTRSRGSASRGERPIERDGLRVCSKRNPATSQVVGGVSCEKTPSLPSPTLVPDTILAQILRFSDT